MSKPTLDIRPLTPALQKKAIEELHEVPERIADDIAALREWIKKQPHLKARTSDQFLISFLRGCKYSLEKAKKKLDNYYTLRSNFPDLFQSYVDDPLVKPIIRLGVGLHLPQPLSEDGPLLVIGRFGSYSPDDYNPNDVMKVGMLVQDLIIAENDNAVISGFVQILDWSGFTAAHLFHMNPMKMKRMTHYAEEALPIRMQASHFINTSSVFEAFFAAVKPFIPQKMLDRMHVHTSMESLYQYVPKKLLPKEYGGENGSIADIIAVGEQTFEKYHDYLLEEKNYGTDEKLRPGKPINFDNIFGTEGSFRQLNVD